MTSKAKIIIKTILFTIYALCLLVSVVVSIVRTSGWFNFIPIIAVIGAFSCSVDEAAIIYKEMKGLFSTKDN